MKSVKLKAYGKINLSIDIVGKRSDGYHLVRMINQSVDIYDEVIVSKEGNAGQSSVIMDGEATLNEKDNLAFKAAELLRKEFLLEDPLTVEIKKNIPMAAGMAGGSTDAAAVLRAVNEICNLNIDSSKMDELALRLGADVPFCLRKGTYLAGGIGEELTPLDNNLGCSVLIVNPGFGISTKEAYKAFDQTGDVNQPDIEGLRKALSDGNIKDAAKAARNVLEGPVFSLRPEIARLKDEIIWHGSVLTLMSGSGATVFGLFENENTAMLAKENIRRAHPQFFCKLTGFAGK